MFVSIDFCGSFWGEISFQSPETNNIFFCVFFEGKSKNGSWIRYSHSQPLGPESRNAPRPHAPSSCEGLRLWITLFTVPCFSQIPSTASRSSALRYGGHLGFICTESSLGMSAKCTFGTMVSTYLVSPLYPSTETQGQSVGSGHPPWRMFLPKVRSP